MCHLIDRCHGQHGVPATLQIDPGVSLLAWPVDVPEALSSSERGLSFPHAAVSLLG
jgi:hypothetical protein